MNKPAIIFGNLKFTFRCYGDLTKAVKLSCGTCFTALALEKVAENVEKIND